MTPHPDSLRIGVLIIPPIQLLDLAPIDLFAMSTASYFAACKLPQPLLDLAIPDDQFEITYISHTGPTSTQFRSQNEEEGGGGEEGGWTKAGPRSGNQKGEPAGTTANVGLHVDCGLGNERVRPGRLDVLFIPGPPPGMHIPREVCEFVRRHVEAGVDLLTVCSGVFVAAASGVLDGRMATGTRGVMDMLRSQYPQVKWTETRYSHDSSPNGGHIWSSGGITNGMDMTATYMRTKLPAALVDTVLMLADVDVRSQEYGQGKIAWTVGVIWLVVRAWFSGLWTGGKGKEKGI